MPARYQYKFVRIGEGWLWVKGSAEAQYREVVHQHAREGWRLVQIFAPGTGFQGSAKYYELIFEREEG
jgi:hypothetical protein